jgi:hypothetical protein
MSHAYLDQRRLCRECLSRAGVWIPSLSAALLLLIGGTGFQPCWAEDTLAFQVRVDRIRDIPDEAQLEVPLKAVIAIPSELAESARASWQPDDEAGGADDSHAPTVQAQLTAPGIVSSQLLSEPPAGQVWREVHWILPIAALRKSWQARLLVRAEPSQPEVSGFHWRHEPDRWAELSYGDRPVLRYMHEPLDESSAERRAETYKVYHHVYDPSGSRLVTKGPGGLYPHHRGLFYGFNKISYDGQEADVWHCNRGERQAHRTTLLEEAGPVLGRHRLSIGWHGRDGQAFADEQREVTAYHVTGGVLIEFASQLQAQVASLRLDGDPQHAGFQFRASQEVPDQTAQQTYYVRPDGVGQPGEFRNWPESEQHVNLPWLALAFVLGDQRYTCLYLDQPDNPKPGRFSERDYGRFGSYFEATLDPQRPLVVNYRIWLQAGEATPETLAPHSRVFVAPPAVRLEPAAQQ